MSVAEWATGSVAAVAWTLLGLLVVLAAALFVRFVVQSARDDSRVETEFAETLAWVRSVADVRSRLRRPSAVKSHRARWQPPGWVLTLAERGRRREPKGYGPPPPLVVVEQPTVLPWSVRDRKAVPWLLNPAVGAASVQRQDRWEELDVARDVLAGDMRAAANVEDTGLIPVQAEVVQ